MSQNNHRLTFPADFVWGAASASYQIEGGAKEDGRGASIWDTFSRTPGAVDHGDSGDVACDHYHRYPEDIGLMQHLGLKAYRFSIAWPRILPKGTGQINEAGVDFYDRLVDKLLESGLTPYATLYHWDLPQTLEDKGGWVDRGVVDAFVEYADVVTRALGDRVHNWLTLNEPWCSAYLGYAIGVHAPGIRNLAAANQASHHLLLAHGKAVPVIRANGNAETRVGIVINPSAVDPASSSPEDLAAAKHFDGFLNRWFFDPIFKGEYPADMMELYGADAPKIQDGDLQAICAPLDMLGINNYQRAVIGQGTDWPPLNVKG